jgi:gliding motility-associated-like protein
MDTHLLSFKDLVKRTILTVVFTLLACSLLKAQVTFSSLLKGDILNGNTGNLVLNGDAGAGSAYFRTATSGGLLQCIAMDGSNNVAFTQFGTTRLMRVDNNHVITFPVVASIYALAIDRDDEFIYGATYTTSTPVNSINRYIWKNTGANTSVGFFVGAALNTSTSTVAIVPFITTGDLVFMNGATTATALNIGQIDMALAFDPTGNLYYADYTNNVIRKIAIEKATPTAAASAATSIILSVAPSTAVKVGDEVSGLYIPVSTYITAISGSTITISKPTTGAINGTSTLAFITGVSDIAGTFGTAGTTLGATAGATLLQKPFSLTFDPSGNLFVADQNQISSKIIKISAPISSASTAAVFGSGYGSNIWGLGTDANGNLYLSDKAAGKILKIGAGGGAASVVVGTAAALQLSQYTNTAGSTLFTTTDLTDLLKVDVGMRLRGNGGGGIPDGSMVTAVNKTTAPYSFNLSAPGGPYITSELPIGTAALGSTTITVSAATGIAAGQGIAGAGIPDNTTVVSISGTTVTISAATTAALAGTQLFFYTAATFGIQTNYATPTYVTNSSSEDGFTTSSGSYGYIENTYGIAVSHDASNPTIVYLEQYQKDVRKISGGGISTNTAVPTITGFTPTTSALAGATITITGTNFTGATAVSFGGENAASFTVNSATTITAVLGTGTTGNIFVTTPGGTAMSPATLKVFPVISSFTPTSGVAGTTVTITGDNFLGAASIKIGGTAVASYIINSNTTITAVTGTGATGTIAINTGAGTTTGTATFTFTTVPTNLVYSTATQTTNYGIAGSSVAPTVSGGAITYSLNPDAPAAITISPTTGIISYGNAVTAGTYNLTVTATNASGSTTAAYTLTVNAIAPSALVYSPAISTANFGVSGSSTTPTINTGGATITYSLTGIVPAAVTINATTGVISYDNTLSAGSYTINATATNSVGSTTATYNITINAIAPATLVYSTASATTNFGTAGSSVTPVANNGGAALTYTLNGTVPSDITINSATGVINYAATLAVGTYPLTVVATNNAGNTSSAYTITVNATVPSALAYTPALSTTNLGSAGLSIAPAINNGGATITYSLSGTVPAGITIDPASGIISFDNTLTVGTYPLTITATNIIGSTTASYTITVNPVAPSALVYTPASLTGERTSAGNSVSPTINSGGAVVTYSLSGTVPSGVTIDPSTGVISYDNTLPVSSYALTVNAANSAGNTTTTFNITINPSSNNSLNNLSISTGTLTPVFNSATASYSVGVPLTVNSISFTPTVSDAGFASVKVNGTAVTSGSTSTPIALVTGPNTINIVVTAQDASTKTYVINVIKSASSNNAQLSALTLSSGSLNPVFNSATLNYTASVANTTTSVTVTPVLSDATARQTVNGTAVASGSASNSIALNVGANIINTAVTAQDGVTIITYSVTINRAGSSNANLSNLVLNSASLSPSFTSSTTNYTATVANNITSITLTPTMADANAAISITGIAVASGNASAGQPLAVGVNNIPVTVTAQDGTIKTYTVTVTRLRSSDANLANIALSSGTLSPVFAPGSTAYTASVTNVITSITLTPTIDDATATLTVNGTTVASGNASQAIPLSVGSNIITTAVTAQDGTTKSYIVTVTRAASSNANLFALGVSSGTLSPLFAQATNAYSVSVANNVSSFTVTPTLADATASIKVNTTAVPSGNTSGNIPLNVGANTITITVTAQDGTINTYTLTVTRTPSAIAALSALSISAGALNPAFDTGTTSYTATVVQGTASVSFTPTLTDATATVNINGITATNSVASAGQPLVVGNNTINVTITAQDGTTIKTYTVIVNRPGAVQTINFAALTAATYGTADIAPGATSSNTGIPVTYTSSNTAVATIVAGNIHVTGTGSTVITASQSGDSNFSPATPVTQTLTVNKAALTITAVNQSKTYGAANPALTAAYTGFVNNETSTVLTTQPTITTTAVTSSPASSYSITPGNAAAANYTISYTGGVLTVNPAVLTVTAVSKSIAYGSAALPALTLTYAGFVNGDTFTNLTTQPTLTTTGTAASNAGTYPITASGGVAANYSFNYVAGTLTISKIALTITPVNASTTYGIIPTFTATYTGFINGDTPASLTTQPTIKTTATVTSTTGNYPITASAAVATNYTITYVAGVLAITPATRTFAFNALADHFYGDADFSPGATVSTTETITYISSDPTIVSIVSGKAHILDVGTVTITASIASATTKYFDVQPLTQTLTIQKGTQTVNFLTLPVLQAGRSVTLNITSNVGLPVDITSSDTTVAIVKAHTVYAISSGTSTITSSQAGDNHYLPATYSAVLTVQDSPHLVNVRSGLSPNGDGKNDTWVLDGIENYPDNKVTIVNRNGVKIFQTSGYNNMSNGFDGHSNITGSLMQAGTYFYILEIKVHDETKRTTGYLILKFN